MNVEQPEIVELSVVIPCLNEAETIGICVRKARHGLAAAGVCGEIIVGDNGSTDGSPERAIAEGARVITATDRGYGAALRAAIGAARGGWIIMGDADDSYDFGNISRFVERLRSGAELVMGCRLPRGGGRIEAGAMPWSHRYVGNPLFSMMARWMYGYPGRDVYCGLRAFTRDFYERLDLRSQGMDFAVEMVLKAGAFGCRFAEVPITLHQDGRVNQRSHLRTFRDGWRTLRLYLLFSPRWLFFFPSLILFLFGGLGTAAVYWNWSWRGVQFDVHTLLISAFAIMLGVNALFFALGVRTYAAIEGYLPRQSRLQTLLAWMSLERVLVCGAAMAAVGVLIVAKLTIGWASAGFGALDYSSTMKVLIPAMTLIAVSIQAVLGRFFIGIFELPGRRTPP
jgi:glycosyltransferase involved in cell wall biosynthesis